MKINTDCKNCSVYPCQIQERYLLRLIKEKEINVMSFIE